MSKHILVDMIDVEEDRMTAVLGSEIDLGVYLGCQFAHFFSGFLLGLEV